MQASRTKNSIRNVTFSSISKVIYIITNFVCRTIFIKVLGSEYVGLNGLFTNILGIFTLVDLGIGSAIVYRLYKPIAEGDTEKSKNLILFYKQVYRIIGIIIAIIGVLIIPFLSSIVGENNINENITIIYILFLIKTVVMYFLYYKREFIVAHQKEYMVSIIELSVCIVQNVLEIIFLILTHNYIVYLIIQMSTTILERIIISVIANKLYPYIKEKSYSKLDKKEKREIFSDVKALTFYRIGYILSDSMDNIIISIFAGLNQVGLLSNYVIVVKSIVSLVSSAFNSLTASIGNLNTTDNNSRKENVYYTIFHLSFIMYGYISIATALLLNKFIVIWIGEEFLLSFKIAIILGINMYIDGMRYINEAYRNTLGLFKKGKYIPLISSGINVILSIILVQYIGVFGVLLATALSRVLIAIWYDPYIIHKYEFKNNFKKFYLRYFYYLVILAATFFVCYKVTILIKITGIVGFLICGIIVTFIVGTIFLLTTLKWNVKIVEDVLKIRKRNVQ